MKELRENNMEHLLKKREVTPWNQRNKLVLPAPQISDSELQEVVKLGRASQQAKELSEGGNAELLSDYSTMTPQRTIGATPGATPAPATDAINRQAQNILALNETDSVLKGGENTFLQTATEENFEGNEAEKENIGDFTGVTPARQAVPTPNRVIGTPQRTPGMTPGQITPGSAARTPGSARDKLGLNTPSRDVAMTPYGEEETEVDHMAALKEGLENLPQPKNDFEIVLEEDLPDGTLDEALEGERAEGFIPDMGDEEERYLKELEARKQYELSKRHAPLKKK